MRSYAAPMVVSGMGSASQTCLALESLPLRPGSGALYDEGWLQRLIQDHPSLLPIDMIEPALVGPTPICLELPVRSGFVDNVMITPAGGMVVVETKLWRNPEARREVVGQVLDYAKDLSQLSYQELQVAVRSARKEPGANLFNLVHGDDNPVAEARFIDAVSRNLRLGRMLLIVAGDGIQESAEQLSDFLQRHLGQHFTLAMVEMSIWRDPVEGRVLVQPRVLTRTVQIERAVSVPPGGQLPPPDRHIHVALIQFNAESATSGPLGGQEERAGAEEGVQHGVACMGDVQQRVFQKRSRFDRRVQFERVSRTCSPLSSRS